MSAPRPGIRRREFECEQNPSKENSSHFSKRRTNTQQHKVVLEYQEQRETKSSQYSVKTGNLVPPKQAALAVKKRLTKLRQARKATAIFAFFFSQNWLGHISKAKTVLGDSSVYAIDLPEIRKKRLRTVAKQRKKLCWPFARSKVLFFIHHKIEEKAGKGLEYQRRRNNEANSPN